MNNSFRKILSITLSCALLWIQLALPVVDGGGRAWAQEAEAPAAPTASDGARNDTGLAGYGPDREAFTRCMAEKKDRRICSNDSNKGLGIDEYEKAATILNYLLTLSIALFGIFVAAKCFKAIKNPSQILFILTSLLHISGEIYSFITYRNIAQESLAISVKDMKLNKTKRDAQVEALTAMKTKVDEMVTASDNKWKIMAAVSAGYGMAAIMAGVELWYSLHPANISYEFMIAKTCTGERQNSQQKGDGVKPKPNNPPANNAPNQGISPSVLNLNTKPLQFFAANSNLLKKLSSYLMAILDKNSSLPLIEEAMAAVTPTAAPSTTPEANNGNMDATNLGPMIGMSVALIGGLIIIFSMTKDQLSETFFNPKFRIPMMIASSLLAVGMTVAINLRIEVLKKRQAYLERLIEKLKAYAKEGFVEDSGLDSILPPPPPLIGGQASKNKYKDLGPCLTRQGSRFILDRFCACNTPPNRCSTDLPPFLTPQGFSLPSSLSLGASDLNRGTTNMMSGNYSGAVSNVGQMGARFAASLPFKNKLFKDINEEFKKQGQPGLNFDQLGDKMAIALRKKGTQALTGKGISLAGLAGGAPDLFLPPSTVDDKGGEGKGNSASSDSGGGGGGGGGGGSMAEAQGTPDNSLDFSMGDEEKENKDEGVGEDGKAPTMEDYESNFHDISQNTSENIFKLVSRRYLITAYPVFLQEETAAEKSEAPKTDDNQ